MDLALRWPYPDARSDKYSRGVVGIDTGSDTYPGAAVMTVSGAVHAGAGMVRFLGADRPAQVIGSQLPNVVFAPGRVQAHLFGSGWGDRADGADVLQQALDSGLPTVVDADGLKYLPEKAARTLAAHPARRRAGPRCSDEERSWVTDDPVRAVRAGVSQDRGDGAAQGRHPAGRHPRTGLGGDRAARPRLDRTGRVGRHLWAVCARPCWPRGGRRPKPRYWPPRCRPTPPPGTRGPIPPTRLVELAAVELGRLQRQDRNAE